MRWQLWSDIFTDRFQLFTLTLQKKTPTQCCVSVSLPLPVCVYSPIQCRQTPPRRFEYTKTTTINNFNATPQIISINEMCSGLSHFSGWEDSWCAERFCHYFSLFSAEITIIVTALLCGDVNTTSSWCCVSSLKPFFHGNAENCFPISAQAARDYCSVSVESVQINNKKKQKKTEMPLQH